MSCFTSSLIAFTDSVQEDESPLRRPALIVEDEEHVVASGLNLGARDEHCGCRRGDAAFTATARPRVPFGVWTGYN
jgi:hypothetical protein